MGTKRNRNAGHDFEEAVVIDLRPLYPYIATARGCNRHRDGEKVDLVNRDELKHGRLPYNFQLKNVCGGVNYLGIITLMPRDLPHVHNVVLHNYTIKKTTKTGTSRFVTAGTFAILQYKDFKQLLKYRRAYEILQERIDALPLDVKKEVEQALNKLEL